MKVRYRKQNTPGPRAQAIVEFALILPVLMMLLVGILEAGRMLYTYAAVNNASREAARFASALGYDDAGYHKYKHCEGIRDRAKRSAYFTPLTITITYDRGPGYSPFAYCDAISGEDNDFTLTTNDRVKVMVSASYTPLVKLIPFPSRTFTSTSARSILGLIEVGESPSSGSGSGTGSMTSTPTPSKTPTPSNTPMASNTPTKTATPGGPIATLTPVTPSSTVPPATSASTATIAATATSASTATPGGPTDTPTLIPTNTMTATPTFTLTVTSTPTTTSTPAPGCNMITTSAISVPGGSPTMSMTITNPHDTITVLNVQVTWNHDTGGPASKPLALQSAFLGSTFWTGSAAGPSLTITPSTTLTIPGNNQTSIITFTFNKNYQITDGTESIVINLSTPGCESYPIHKP